MCAVKLDVAWSPSEINRFVTVGTDIQVYEIEEVKDGVSKMPNVPVSESSNAILVSSCTDNQFLRCYSWYPKLDHPLLFAIGTTQGRVHLESLDPNTNRDVEVAGRELLFKGSRVCTCLSWNPIESNLLINGMDKCRGDNSIYLWDVTRSFLPSESYDRRPVFNYDAVNANKPVLELVPQECVQSLQWFPNNSKIFVCGLASKQLRVYDTRENTKYQENTLSKAVLNLCIDPNSEHRLASSFDNSFVLWDLRNFEKPVVTISRPKPVVKLTWSPTRSGLLTVLCKESFTVNLYDIQSPIGNDEVEPALVERNVQPYASHSVMSFAWHPVHESRMLTISQNNDLYDYLIADRITLNWSPTSEIVWTYGKKVLQCVDSRDEFYSCLNDISVKMRKRACQGYGLKMPKIWQNAELADDTNVKGVWMWLDLVKTIDAESKKRSHNRQLKYEGVYQVICGESGSSTLGQSESRKVKCIGIKSTECKIVKYTSEERERALQLCGWGSDLDSSSFYRFLERLESDGQYTRAATIAVFSLDICRAISILSKGALAKIYKGKTEGTTDLNAVAMALAGYTEEKSTLWQEVSSSLKSQLSDSHLRAMFTFLTAEGDYDEILRDRQIAVRDRIAFACMYLNDKKLAEFLDGLRKRMIELGNLDGILLTGLTKEGISLIQRYVDTTGDVQTASLIILHTLPSEVNKDEKAKSWVENYRNLLDTWKLWTHRALFDVNWFKKNPYISKPSQQIFVSCNFCRKSVSNYLQFRPPVGTARTTVTSANRKITCCPGCRKPLPRCSLCLCHMGTAAGLQWHHKRDNKERKKMTDFSNWLTWCQTCRHGGHSVHILEWFKHNNECPVTGCMCKCMSLDATGKLLSEQN